jgi:hypothetical protein
LKSNTTAEKRHVLLWDGSVKWSEAGYDWLADGELKTLCSIALWHHHHRMSRRPFPFSLCWSRFLADRRSSSYIERVKQAWSGRCHMRVVYKYSRPFLQSFVPHQPTQSTSNQTYSRNFQLKSQDQNCNKSLKYQVSREINRFGHR